MKNSFVLDSMPTEATKLNKKPREISSYNVTHIEFYDKSYFYQIGFA